MKYYSKKVVDLIENELNKKSGEKVLIKIENFQEYSLYYEICSELEDKCFSKGIELTVKLSNCKYLEWKKVGVQKLDFFIKKDWIDLENHMTNFRNMSVNKKTLILLLATETVEDRGGLEDFFLMSPEIVDHHIGENYHMFFSQKYDNGAIDGYEDVIDKIFKSIFDYYPKNIFKLSCLVDKLPKNVKDIDNLVGLIFERLHIDWEIPRILTVPVRGELKRGKKISILEKSIKFARRLDFKDFTKNKLNKLEEQLNKFEQESLPSCNISGDEFIELKRKLIKYAKGKDLEEVKQDLFRMDFHLLDKILEIKLGKGPVEKKEKKIILRGETFEVFARALLITISNYLTENMENQSNIDSVEFYFSEVGIAEISENPEELFNVWRNICNYSGGILEFINKEGLLWEISEEELKLRYEIGREFFLLSNAKVLMSAGILKKLPVTKKLSSIKFSVNLNNEKECFYSKEIEWKFKNNEDWLMSFSFLNSEFQDEIIGGSNIPFIPSGTVKNIKAFLYLNDEEEFFDILEKNELDLSENICQKEIFSHGNLSDTLDLLGLEFNKLLKEIYNKGLFNAINQGDITAFLSRYKNSLEIVSKEEINQENKEIIEIFIKLFSVVDINEKIESGLDINVAIIPPYHPATLEKIQERYLFLRSGIFELLKIIMKNPQDSSKIIDEKIRVFNDLSSIQSSVDVLVGRDKKCLDTRGVYGLYTVLSSKQIEATNQRRLDYNMILKKENALTDERAHYKESVNSRLIAKVINNYINIYPSSIDGLKLAFVNPKELQPIIASLNSLINATSNSLLKNEVFKISLNIFAGEENIGGKSYLAYWIENIFEEDSNIDITIYYNTHSNKDCLERNINKYIEHDTDIIFVTNLLEENNVEFRRVKNIKLGAIENKFPMIFKPLPIRIGSSIRSIELSQPQFSISTAHSNLVCKIKEGNDGFDEKSLIKDYLFTENSKGILEKLKERGNWTICLDKGIDQHLISKLDEINIIGFFPGQGAFGEYNLTISGKNNSLETLNKKLKVRLKKSFKGLKKEDLEVVSNNCINSINELNGIKILEALNVNDYGINDFLAYFMTHKLVKSSDKCWGLIPLDFHQKWFSEVNNRPDFLKFEMNAGTGDKVKIKATIIECKLADENYQHKEKALHQIEEGYKALKEKFSEKSQLIERRYWFAQLYKNMVYSEMLNSVCNDEYLSLSSNLFKILEGEFELEWEGKIFTYWINSELEEISRETMTSIEDINIECIEVPRKIVEDLLKNVNNTKFQLDKNIHNVVEKKLNSEPEKIIEEGRIISETPNSLKGTNKIGFNNSKSENTNKIEFASVLDTQEENNNMEFEMKYAKEKLRSICTDLRKNNVDVDPYLEDNDNGIIIGPNFIKLKLKLDTSTSISKLLKFNKDMKLWLTLDESPIIYADKGYVAVEISRQNNLTIKLGSVLSKLDLTSLKNGLQFVLGIDEQYNPYILNLADSNNPHLLIAGSTGSGKSVLINSIIINLMSIYTPNELEFIFIDPKVVELGVFQGSPYLKGREISTEAEMAVENLKYIVDEMENRYKLLAKNRVKNIEGYNEKVQKSERLSRVVIVFDEFADFMEDKDFKQEIESSIKRISAKARAAGIHMIICTQSPRGDVITPIIRNNLGARVGLRVPDHHASSLILSESGAENLKGKGDMLFKSPNTSTPIRLKSPFLSDDELDKFLENINQTFKGAI